MAAINLLRRLLFTSASQQPTLSLVNYRWQRFYFALPGAHNSEFFVAIADFAKQAKLLGQVCPADAYFIGTVFGELYAKPGSGDNSSRLEFPEVRLATANDCKQLGCSCLISGINLRQGILLYTSNEDASQSIRQREIALVELPQRLDLVARFPVSHAYHLGFANADWLLRHQKVLAAIAADAVARPTTEAANLLQF